MNQLFIFFIVLFTGLFFDRLDIFKICIISSLLHECGHIFAYRFFIKKWPEIEISVFALRMKNNVSYNKFIRYILIRGPLVNFFICILTFVLNNISATVNGYIWFYVNLIICVFNMFPVWFLDGGQILYCFNPFYQRNYLFFSFLFITIITVMLFTFTGFNISIIIVYLYFIINILNDI